MNELEKRKKYVEELSLEVYNYTYKLEVKSNIIDTHDAYFCIKGINGHASVISMIDSSWKLKVKQHILQMGRDSLKMELNTLLSITGHH